MTETKDDAPRDRGVRAWLKDAARRRIDAAAAAFDGAAAEVEPGGPARDLLAGAACGARDAALALDRRSVDEIEAEVVAFARRRPALFVGAAALAGLAAARLAAARPDGRDGRAEFRDLPDPPPATAPPTGPRDAPSFEPAPGARGRCDA